MKLLYLKKSYCFLNSNKQNIFFDIKYSKKRGQDIYWELIDNKKEIFYDSNNIKFIDSEINYELENYTRINDDNIVCKQKHQNKLLKKFTIFFTFFIREIICYELDSKNKSKCKKQSNWQLIERNNIIIIDNQLYRCTKYKDLSLYQINRKECLSLVKFINHLPKMEFEPIKYVICFDCETCLLNGSIHEPYMLYATFCINNDIIDNILLTCHKFDYKNDIGQQFYDWFINILYKYNPINAIRIFGYNNNKFDNHFILDTLIDNNFKVNINIRNLLTTGTILNYKSWQIKIGDLIKWIPDTSLKNACIDFGTSEKKIDLNIVTFNKMCEEKKEILLQIQEQDFKKIFNNPNFIEFKKLKTKYYNSQTNSYNIYQAVQDYCIADVNATYGLYLKINETLKYIINYFEKNYKVKLFSQDCLDYVSPSYFMSLIYKQIFDQNNYKRIKVNWYEYGKFISNTYFGGYVNYGCIGEYHGKIEYQDVTSMYPLAMTGLFPLIRDNDDIEIGKDIDLEYYQNLLDIAYNERQQAFENKTLDNFTFLKIFNRDLRGIFYCDIYPPDDKYNLITFAPCPFRDEMGEKLIYNNLARTNIVLCSAEFKNLILTGYKIKLLPHEYNTLFKYSDYIFKKIIQPLSEMKASAKQDSNNALKKLLKLFMNGISGKLGQKNFHFISEVTNEDIYEGEELAMKLSTHYLATFITAESRHILYSTMYKLQLNYIYNKLDLSYRVGSLLYMDTDSIIFDRNLVDNYTFKQDDELGYFEEEKNEYNSTWKRKYNNNVNTLIILGRKSYITCENNKIIKRTLKGIKTEHMTMFNYDDLKSICDGNAKQIEFNSLVKKTNKNSIFTKIIEEEIVKKSLQKETNYFKIECNNEIVYNLNKDNINKTIYKDNIKNFLEFTCSKY